LSFRSIAKESAFALCLVPLLLLLVLLLLFWLSFRSGAEESAFAIALASVSSSELSAGAWPHEKAAPQAPTALPKAVVKAQPQRQNIAFSSPPKTVGVKITTKVRSDQ
jgi:hypothetical protein